jgi:hypothetical protein
MAHNACVRLIALAESGDRTGKSSSCAVLRNRVQLCVLPSRSGLMSTLSWLEHLLDMQIAVERCASERGIERNSQLRSFRGLPFREP